VIAVAPNTSAIIEPSEFKNVFDNTYKNGRNNIPNNNGIRKLVHSNELLKNNNISVLKI
jgi:hypothetical protein